MPASFIAQDGIDRFTPCRGGLVGDGVLFVEHTEREVEVGRRGDQLRANGLAILDALVVERLVAEFAVAQPRENIDLPAGRHGKVVSPSPLRITETAYAAWGASVKEGSSESRAVRSVASASSTCNCAVRRSVLRSQHRIDELLQPLVGEERPPVEVGQRGRVGRSYGLAVDAVGRNFGTRVGFVDAAARHKQGDGCE